MLRGIYEFQVWDELKKGKAVHAVTLEEDIPLGHNLTRFTVAEVNRFLKEYDNKRNLVEFFEVVEDGELD